MNHAVASVFLALVFVASAAQCAEVGECGELNRIENLVDPVKSYADGAIKLAHVNIEEPVCCASHLLVITQNDAASQQCFAVSQTAAGNDNGPRGYSSIDLSKVRSSYDPKLGRLFRVTFYEYDDGKRTKPQVVNIRVDLSGEGSVRVEP